MANTRAQQLSLIATNIPDNNTKQVTPAKVRQVENADVAAAAYVDDDNDFTGVNNHTKEVRWHKGSDLTAATTIALGVTGNYHHILGDTTIEGFSTKQHGTRMLFMFEGVPILTASSSLILPNDIDIQISAGDVAEFVSEGGGNWRFISLNNPKFVNSVSGLTVDNGSPFNPIIRPVHSFFNGIPGVGQDSTQGYIAGKSRIIDFNTQIEYFCYDASVGAANWIVIGVCDVINVKYGFGSGALNGATNGIAIGENSGNSNSGARLMAFGNGAGSGNTADDVVSIGFNAGQANSIANAFIISNSNLPSFADFAAASAAFATGAIGNTYLYHDQSTNSIGAYRL